MEEKKELTLRLPEDLFAVLKDFKKISGISYTGQIKTALIWFLFSRGLLDMSWLKEKHTKNGKQEEVVNLNPLPEGVTFCDGDSCMVDPRGNQHQPKLMGGGC